MGADLLLVAAAEPVYRRVYDPAHFRHARFRDDAERTWFREQSLCGPPLATLDGTLLNMGNLAAHFHDGATLEPPPPGIHYPDSQPSRPKRPAVAKSIRYLNGIYLAEFLGRHGLAVDVVNHLEEDFDLAEDSFDRGPRAIGISSTFLPNRESVERLARESKRLRPDLPVIVGGAHAHVSYRLASDRARWGEYGDELKEAYFFFDDAPVDVDYFVVDLRGEETLLRLLTALKNRDDVRNIPNLAVKNERGGYDFTAREPERYDPRRHEVQWTRVPDEHLGEAVSLAASSGCPFPCGFCNFDAHKSGMGTKSMDQLVAELHHLRERGYVRRIYYTDDILFQSRAQLAAFCDRIRAEGLADLAWGGFARIDLLEAEDAQILRDAGCSFLNFGIESGAMKIQAAMAKRLDPRAVPEKIGAVNRAGIWTNSAFVVGYPGETPETIDETIALLNAYPDNEPGINFYASYLLNIQPFMPAEANRAEYSLEGMYYDWAHSTMDTVEALKQHRRLDLSVHGALLAYPGDVAGLGRFLSTDNTSVPRLHRVIRCRKALERAQHEAASAGAGENGRVGAAIAELGSAVKEAVTAAAAADPGKSPIDVPKS